MDVVFTFAGFNATGAFPGTSNKTLEEIITELGGRGLECINLRVMNTVGILSIPYRLEMVPDNFTVNFLGSSGTYGLRLYTAILTSAGGLNITGEPKANLTGTSI